MAVKQTSRNQCAKTVFPAFSEKIVNTNVVNVKRKRHATLPLECVQMVVRTTGSFQTVQHVNLISTARNVHWTVATVNKGDRVLWLLGLVLMDAREGGLENAVIQNVKMERMFYKESVLNVKVYV